MEKPKLVAEMSINHLGMINILKEMIKSAKYSGADYVKLKLKNVNGYYGDSDKNWRNFNFNEYRSSLEISRKDFVEIDKYCKSIGIEWFCTVHDVESLKFIAEFDVPFFKVASMDIDREEFVDEVISVCVNKNRPLIASIGGKNNSFTENIISKLKSHNVQAFIMHTVSIYPTPIGDSNVNYISYLKDRYEDEMISIGYSGHEIGYAATLVASYLGVSMIERHYTLTRSWNIHHINAALTPSEFKKMRDIIDDSIKERSSMIVEYHANENNFLIDRDYV